MLTTNKHNDDDDVANEDKVEEGADAVSTAEPLSFTSGSAAPTRGGSKFQSSSALLSSSRLWIAQHYLSSSRSSKEFEASSRGGQQRRRRGSSSATFSERFIRTVAKFFGLKDDSKETFVSEIVGLTVCDD